MSESDTVSVSADLYEGENFLEHIGIARRSGRYPWGSGGDAYQRSTEFKKYRDELKAGGMSQTEIAKSIEAYANKDRKEGEPFVSFKTTDLVGATAVATEQIHAANVSRARILKDQRQMSNVAIAEAMGTRESTVRGWLKAGDEIKENGLRSVANKLKEELETKEYLDVGKGSNLWIGNVGETKLRSALAMLKDEGYNVYSGLNVPQLGTSKDTKLRVLTKEGNSWKDALDAVKDGRLETIGFQMDDMGTIRSNKVPPVSFNAKKLEVRYLEEGGNKMDGVIEVRRGKEELSLGANRYAQVRIAVDGSHYLKGMAIYADDLPDGVDIRFNTNKSKTDSKIIKDGKLGALKPMKTVDGEVDNDNPFGATTKPHFYDTKSGVKKQSVMNMVNEEGAWDDWSKSLSSQMLSKQPLALASKQLAQTQKQKREDLDKILSLTNPVVRQKMLDEYAEGADSAAVHLKAAALPRQSSHVILPVTSMRKNEIYAPNFDDGDRVVLVRYPHGGAFEIPELIVNKKNAQAKRIMGGARDAVGIHPSVAEQLSGADFDGDSVLVIPNPTRAVKTRPPLKELEGFDAKVAYRIPDGDTTTKRMTKKGTQTEMGKISNLITDMTIHGASESELARAVKHSQVVIDAEKHGLNYKQSELDNGIKGLKLRYQGDNVNPRAGANTIISRASADYRIPAVVLRSQKDGGPVDPKTGRLVYMPDPKREYPKREPVIDPVTGVQKIDAATGKKVYRETGETGVKITQGTKMEFTPDARKLMSKNPAPMEELYAAHANSMKAMANEARLASLSLTKAGLPLQNKAAKVVYKDEVASLEAKLTKAQRNAPLERRAQVLGNALAKARIDAHPEYANDKDAIKKIKYRSLEDARLSVGANKYRIGVKDADGNETLTSREWEAIQAGAFSSSRLKEILANADMDRVTSLATPRAATSLTVGQVARAQQMAAMGRSMSEISEALGIPRSTIVDNLNKG